MYTGYGSYSIELHWEHVGKWVYKLNEFSVFTYFDDDHKQFSFCTESLFSEPECVEALF